MDGLDWSVMFHSRHGLMCVGTIKAMTERKAKNLAAKIYGNDVYVEPTKPTREYLEGKKK